MIVCMCVWVGACVGAGELIYLHRHIIIFSPPLVPISPLSIQHTAVMAPLVLPLKVYCIYVLLPLLRWVWLIICSQQWLPASLSNLYDCPRELATLGVLYIIRNVLLIAGIPLLVLLCCCLYACLCKKRSKIKPNKSKQSDGKTSSNLQDLQEVSEWVGTG